MSQQDINTVMGHEPFMVGEHLIRRFKPSEGTGRNEEATVNLIRKDFRKTYRKHIISIRRFNRGERK